MKLYCDSASTTCRPILLLAAESGLALDIHEVSLFTGEHMSEWFGALNPNRLVPVLEDGDFRLTESSAILRYLADAAGSVAYPREPRMRAKVDEAMTWFMANLYRDFGYGIVYPQVMPHYRRTNPVVQDAVIEWGREKTDGWMRILNDHMIGPRRTWLVGDAPSIADYMGTCMISLGEAVNFDLSPYPNVIRWMEAMKGRRAWNDVNAAFYGLLAAMRPREALSA